MVFPRGRDINRCVNFADVQRHAVDFNPTRLNEAAAFFNRLHRLGCGICLEHFGSSLDSAQLLKHLYVDYVKVDGVWKFKNTRFDVKVFAAHRDGWAEA